jgi:hypothetical protein
MSAANSDNVSATSKQSQQSSARFESFTEAVPLSLSSMAHANLPLLDGVLDGIKQVLQHTLFSCVNFARIVQAPHTWTFTDLATSPFAWEPLKGGAEPPKDLPHALHKLEFKHQYTRNALIYLKPAVKDEVMTREQEVERLKDWSSHTGILGRVSLLYASTEPLTQGELDGTDTEDMPPTMLYKVVVEYRSLPATGNQQAVQAEELSMLSFGGSVDDDVKYGALAGLYDEQAKYVLEIYSVRGKKYKFDLMDSTLSNGTIPRLPSSTDGDPFVKSLCATVTDHNTLTPSEQRDKKCAITRIHLTLEGKPRKSPATFADELPRFDHITEAVKASFLLLNPEPIAKATAMPSGHTLLLDPTHAGRVYVNGRYVTTWGEDPRIGSHGVALFGMDLHSIPFWHGRIVDFEVLKTAYAQLWHEILVDARLLEMNIASKLLYRLMTGRDPDSDKNDEYDDDDAYPDIINDCLESQVLSSPDYDRVGIGAKALATRFKMDLGPDAFPCPPHEVEWVKRELPDRKPVVVPHRLISVLRRGGYFDTQQTIDEMWFTESRRPRDGPEQEIVAKAIQLLEEADCFDLSQEQITVVSSDVAKDVVAKDAVCRYSEAMEQYTIQETFFDAPVTDYVRDEFSVHEIDVTRIRAYLLGMYLAREHPDGNVLARYLLRNKSF